MKSSKVNQLYVIERTFAFVKKLAKLSRKIQEGITFQWKLTCSSEMSIFSLSIPKFSKIYVWGK